MSTVSHQFTVGTIECTALADGTYAYGADALFANALKDEAEQVLRERNLKPDAIDLSYTGLVINTGGHRVLVDTGIGAGAVPTAGALVANLEAIGLKPADIDTVILTHAHPDHIGGNVADGRPVFPNARYVISKADWDFFTAEDTLERLMAGRLYGVEWIDQFIGTWAKNNLAPLAGGVDLIEGERDIVPGVRVLPAKGHTPGHTGLVVSSGGQYLLHIADAVLHPIHLDRPDWYPVFDLDRDQAAATRQTLLDRAAADKTLVLAYHFPFPSLGYLISRTRGWSWQPAQPS